tara:strand:+ start:416 stop:805 length:390 start_codon:yes stop_codon:yes gene_type:complete
MSKKLNQFDLEIKLEALQKLLNEKVAEQNTYQNQIKDLQNQLADLNKPKLTGEQFDELQRAIETGIMNYDFDEQDQYSIDFGIDYDNRICCEAFSFDNADDLVHEVYERVASLFAEADEDEDDNQENQD